MAIAQASKPRAGDRLPRRLVLVWKLAAVIGLALYAGHLQFHFGGPGLNDFFDRWFGDGLEVFAASGCLVRAWWVRSERVAWMLIGLGLMSWSLGDVLFDFVYNGNPPFPSIADGFYLGLYPACYVGLCLLVRDRVSRFNMSLWLDGLMAALAAGAVGASVIFQVVLNHSEGRSIMLLTNLAYPLGDTLLLALVIGIIGLTGWRPGRTWGAVGLGFVLIAIADSTYLIQTATSSYSEASVLNALWPAGLLLVASSALHEPGRPSAARVELEGRSLLVTPIVCGLAATGVLFANRFAGLNPLAVTLATVTLLTVLARTALTFHENASILERMRVQSLTDSLTDLGNRRKLMADLSHALDPEGEPDPRLLVIFDLNGFKQYNDTFGHPAGDTLLASLASRLAESVEPIGECYRLGGDEFCVLAAVSVADAELFLNEAVAALSDEGDGFRVSTAFGAAFIPEEASDPTAALRLADQRLYAQKHSGAGGRSEPHQLLMRALSERQPHLRDQHSSVANLAAAVGKRFKLPAAELEELRLAAELHDVGKLAIPEAILERPGALTDTEWAFITQHTVIGQRILAGLPVLQNVGQIVRATHEHWDGTGYVDGVSGQSIPLASRIIAVCDAYTAMVQDRPYRSALDPAEAVAELKRCAGTQFDPAVVEAFCKEVPAELLAAAAEQHALA